MREAEVIALHEVFHETRPVRRPILLGAVEKILLLQMIVVNVGLEILRQATSTNAALLQQGGKLGCIKPGAHADLLIVDGDPLKNIEFLAASGRKLRLIMRAGELIRNELG
jgi:imidazolonepropionase-like amidohydrolase